MTLVMTLAVTLASADAGGLEIDGCVGGWISSTCVTRWGEANDPFVRIVPQPSGQAEQARAQEREHKWVGRCRPVITQDRYGVGRYQYFAPGCEFGVGEY
jgi:hypothetical protein